MAISRERLEELIEKEATIYSARILVREIQLNDLIQIYTEHGEDVIVFGYEPNDWEELKDLYETKEQAEWHLKYHATRTEELDLPMWEEIQSNIDEVKNDKDKIKVSFIKQFNHSQLGYIDLVIVKIEEEPIQLEVSNNDHYVQSWRATKENYIEACDLCIKLFKGEEDDK